MFLASGAIGQILSNTAELLPNIFVEEAPIPRREEWVTADPTTFPKRIILVTKMPL